MLGCEWIKDHATQVYIVDFLDQLRRCTPERTTTPIRPHRYIAQLGILSYKGGYKDKEEEAIIPVQYRVILHSTGIGKYCCQLDNNNSCCMKPYKIKGSECQYMIYCTANISHIALRLLIRRATANTIEPPPYCMYSVLNEPGTTAKASHKFSWLFVQPHSAYLVC